MILSISVTFNPDINLLENQIKSLQEQVDLVLIIDNGSGNIVELEGLLCSSHENVKLIKFSENMGLAKAQNFGINYAKENNYDYIVLFDQDSIPGKEFISHLYNEYIKIVDTGEKVSAVGPFYFDPNIQEVYPATLYYGPFIKRLKPLNSPVKVTFIIASGSLISVENIKVIGDMKEDFFIDYIDVEWCLRSKKMGYNCYMIPSVTMEHSIGDNRINFLGRSISIHSPLRRYYLMRNSFIISRLPYIPFGYKVRELFLNFIRFFVFIIISNDKKNVWSFSLAGLKDGILGKTGKKLNI